jgi:hypothetical protein
MNRAGVYLKERKKAKAGGQSVYEQKWNSGKFVDNYVHVKMEKNDAT